MEVHAKKSERHRHKLKYHRFVLDTRNKITVQIVKGGTGLPERQCISILRDFSVLPQ